MSRHTKKPAAFAPAAWQWDPSSVTSARVQWWSAAGTMSVVPLAEARKLVASRAAFVGSANHVCQVHDGIDGRAARETGP